MKQNEAKWCKTKPIKPIKAKWSQNEGKLKHCTLGDLGKIGRILAIFWKNKQFLPNYDILGKIHENTQNAYQMGGFGAKN